MPTLEAVQTSSDSGSAAGRPRPTRAAEATSSDDSDNDLDDIEDAGAAAGEIQGQSFGLRRRTGYSRRLNAASPGMRGQGQGRGRGEAKRVPADTRSCCAKLCCVLSCGCCCRAMTSDESDNDTRDQGTDAGTVKKVDKHYTVKDMTEHLEAHRLGTTSRIDADRGIFRDSFDPHDIPMCDLVMQFVWYSVTLFVWGLSDYYFSTVDPDHRGGTWAWVQNGAILHAWTPREAEAQRRQAAVVQLSLGPAALQATREADGEAGPSQASTPVVRHMRGGPSGMATTTGTTLNTMPSVASNARTLGAGRGKQKEERMRPTKPGRDLYVWTASIQLFILLYTVLFYGAMTGGGTDIGQELA